MNLLGDLGYEGFTAGGDFIGLQEKLNNPAVRSLGVSFQNSYTRLVFMHGLPLHIAYWAAAAATATKDRELIDSFGGDSDSKGFADQCRIITVAMKRSGFVPGADEKLNPYAFGTAFMKYAQFILSSAPCEENFIAHGIESIFFFDPERHIFFIRGDGLRFMGGGS